MVNSAALTLETSYKLVLVEAHEHSSQNLLSSITCSIPYYVVYNWRYSHTPLFSNLLLEQVLVGFLWNFSAVIFGIQCSVKPITKKISDRVGCLCAILVLFARLFVGMRRSSHQRKFCNSNTIGCSHHSGNLSV